MIAFARLLAFVASGSYFGFVFALRPTRGRSDIGTALFVLLAAVATALRQALLAVSYILTVVYVGGATVASIITLISLGVSLLVAGIFALLALHHLSKAVTHSLVHSLVAGFVALAGAVSYAVKVNGPVEEVILQLAGKAEYEVQLLLLLLGSPVGHIILRRLVDRRYASPEAVLSSVASAALSLAHLLFFGSRVYLYYVHQLEWPLVVLFLADLLFAAMFALQIPIGHRTARRMHESSYSPLIGDPMTSAASGQATPYSMSAPEDALQ